MSKMIRKREGDVRARMRETIMKRGIVFILVLLAIGVVSGIAGIGKIQQIPGWLWLYDNHNHNHNPGNYPVKVNANANHFAV